MKPAIVLIIVAFLGWAVGPMIENSAYFGMFLGVLFGTMVGLPLALLVVGADKKRQRDKEGPG